MPHQFLLAKCGAEPHRTSAYHVLPGLQCRDPFLSRRALGTPQVLLLDCPGHSALRAGDTGGRMDALELGISNTERVCAPIRSLRNLHMLLRLFCLSPRPGPLSARQTAWKRRQSSKNADKNIYFLA